MALGLPSTKRHACLCSACVRMQRRVVSPVSSYEPCTGCRMLTRIVSIPVQRRRRRGKHRSTLGGCRRWCTRCLPKSRCALAMECAVLNNAWCCQAGLASSSKDYPASVALYREVAPPPPPPRAGQPVNGEALILVGCRPQRSWAVRSTSRCR